VHLISTGNGTFLVRAPSPALLLFRRRRAQEMRGRSTRLYGRSDSRRIIKFESTPSSHNILGSLIKWPRVDIYIRDVARARKLRRHSILVRAYERFRGVKRHCERFSRPRLFHGKESSCWKAAAERDGNNYAKFLRSAIKVRAPTSKPSRRLRTSASSSSKGSAANGR
jgi:hypothetical protein